MHNGFYSVGLTENIIICRPHIKDSELHPEEGTVSQLTENMWFDTFNEIGQIEDDVSLRKVRENSQDYELIRSI